MSSRDIDGPIRRPPSRGGDSFMFGPATRRGARARSWLIPMTAAILASNLNAIAMAHPSRPEQDRSLGKTNKGAIRTPNDARKFGLESLRVAVAQDGGVPLPENIDEYVRDRAAAVRLGKALFWDMQVGSDGVQSCASCHFHAGTDNRTRGAVNPGNAGIVNDRQGAVLGLAFAAGSPNTPLFDSAAADGELTRNHFPLVKTIQSLLVNDDGSVLAGPGNSDDVVGSMGMLFTRFIGVQPGLPIDLGEPLADPLFNVNGTTNTRRVESRNTPTVINAVFNLTNFWDGRANFHFNGQNAFGDYDSGASIVVHDPETGSALTQIALKNGSLASQAMNPPTSPVEMSFGVPAEGNSRTLFDIGQKLLRPPATGGAPLVPLAGQRVHPWDSVLGGLANGRLQPGLATTYAAMIQRAFKDRYWSRPTPLPSGITQMEGNFGLFFGLSVALYESTLVSDQTAFDRWMETGRFNRGFGRDELAGLNLFVGSGGCVKCHSGPEFSDATIRQAKSGERAIGAKALSKGSALYDVGFHNIGVTPTTEDIGRGGSEPFGFRPLAYARLAALERTGLAGQVGYPPLTLPIIGDNGVPARDENVGAPVCDDQNGDDLCGPDEPLRPEFQRVAVDGAFKTPGLRNADLTGPYFHNGGMATLRQAVQFYNRGGNFCRFNGDDLDTRIRPLGLTSKQEEQLVAFLESLTDLRVRKQAAPFDHPELRIPEDELDSVGRRVIKATGWFGDWRKLKPFLNLDPQDPIFTPAGVCQIEAST